MQTPTGHANGATAFRALLHARNQATRHANPNTQAQDIPFMDDSRYWSANPTAQPESNAGVTLTVGPDQALFQSKKAHWLSAAKAGNKAELSSILEDGIDTDCHDKLDKNALHLSAEEGHDQTVDFLLKHTNIQLDGRSESKKNALHYAATGNTVDHVRCAELLLRSAGKYAPAYANTHDWVGQTPLMYAASSDSAPMVRLLLKYGATPDLENAYGATALMDAAARGHVGIADLLVGTRAIDVNKGNFINGTTALMMAAREGHLEMVLYLLSKGADPSRRERRKHHSAADLAQQKLLHNDLSETAKARYQQIIQVLQVASRNKTPQPPQGTLEFPKEPVPSLHHRSDRCESKEDRSTAITQDDNKQAKHASPEKSIL